MEPPSSPTVRIVSLNIHCWRDRGGGIDAERIIAYLARLNPTVLALQEVTLTTQYEPNTYLSDLAAQLKMEYGFQASADVHFGNVLLWRSPVTGVTTRGGFLSRGGSWRRSYFMLSGVADGLPLSVCVTHLDHLSEEKRIRQLSQIRRELSQNLPLILLGDFNSLYCADYSSTELAKIAHARRANSIEPPKFQLMDGLIQDYQVFPAQFKPTCPYGTRVDYILAHRTTLAASQWQVQSSEITNIEVSDHAALILELRRKQANAQP